MAPWPHRPRPRLPTAPNSMPSTKVARPKAFPANTNAPPSTGSRGWRVSPAGVYGGLIGAAVLFYLLPRPTNDGNPGYFEMPGAGSASFFPEHRYWFNTSFNELGPQAKDWTVQIPKGTIWPISNPYFHYWGDWIEGGYTPVPPPRGNWRYTQTFRQGLPVIPGTIVPRVPSPLEMPQEGPIPGTETFPKVAPRKKVATEPNVGKNARRGRIRLPQGVNISPTGSTSPVARKSLKRRPPRRTKEKKLKGSTFALTLLLAKVVRAMGESMEWLEVLTDGLGFRYIPKGFERAGVDRSDTEMMQRLKWLTDKDIWHFDPEAFGKTLWKKFAEDKIGGRSFQGVSDALEGLNQTTTYGVTGVPTKIPF